MIKSLLNQLIERKGFSLNRQQYFERKDYGTIYIPRSKNIKLLSMEIESFLSILQKN